MFVPRFQIQPSDDRLVHVAPSCEPELREQRGLLLTLVAKCRIVNHCDEAAPGMRSRLPLAHELHRWGSVCPQRTPSRVTRSAKNGCSDAVQEVSIMRKVRHKNVVQFIGACTRKPNLCIVVEYMPGGSVYDYMRRVSPPRLLVRVAHDLAWVRRFLPAPALVGVGTSFINVQQSAAGQRGCGSEHRRAL